MFVALRMKIRASVLVEKGSGYIFKLHESEPDGFPKNFKVIFEEFNYYDGEDDQIIVVEEPKIEVHISNIHKRESFRHRSYVSQKSTAVIAGFGTDGYIMALRAMKNYLIK